MQIFLFILKATPISRMFIHKTAILKKAAFQMTSPPLPITITAGASQTLQFKFSPTEIKVYSETAILKKADGTILYKVELKGKGIATQPTIADFNPKIAHDGDTITITGTNFTGTTNVSIGGVSVIFTVSNPTTIDAEISDMVNRGVITVTTPNGTATSSATFRRLIR